MGYPYKIDVRDNLIIGKEIIFLDSVGSTNDEAKIRARESSADGTVIFSFEQIRGRGRINKSWLSQPGKGIFMSVILRPEKTLKAEHSSALTLVMGLACANAVEKSACFGSVLIKWPNDILINTRKTAGTLIESCIEGGGVKYVIAGIGVNVNNTIEDFPAEISGRATSLLIESGAETDISVIAQTLLKEIDLQYNSFIDGKLAEIIVEYKNKCINLHKRVCVKTAAEIIEGVACDITEEGGLVISMDSGEKRVVYSGEASVRAINGDYI